MFCLVRRSLPSLKLRQPMHAFAEATACEALVGNVSCTRSILPNDTMNVYYADCVVHNSPEIVWRSFIGYTLRR